jgi:hypothetical protein
VRPLPKIGTLKPNVSAPKDGGLPFSSFDFSSHFFYFFYFSPSEAPMVFQLLSNESMSVDFNFLVF